MRVILLLTLVATGLAAVNIRQVNSRTARKFITPPQNSDMAAGTNFVFSFLNSHLFPNDSSFTENLFVTITNPSASVAQVSITSKYEGFNTTNVTVPPKTSQVIQIFPASIQVDYMDKNVGYVFTDTKSIYVTSNLPIKLVATNQLSDSSSEDAFAVLPLGTSYIAVVDESAGSSMDQATNIITVIATQDNTAVDMSPVVAQVVTINAGEQVSVAVKALINSLYIQANKPVAVISGAVCGYGFEDNPIHCSHEALMLYPLVDFGTEYPVFKYLPESRGDIIIFFTQNKTTLKGDQEVVGLFGPEVYLVVTVDPGVFISTDKPIYTAQFGNVNAQDQGAPFLAHVTPPNLFTSGPVTFATGYTQDETDNMVHYVRVVTDLNNIGSLIVQNFAKGTTVQPNGLLYRRMGVSTYYFVDVQVPRGQYTVSSALSSAKFSVTVYGYGQYRSYAYNAGLDLPVTGIC